ncbi:hypothetical protein AB1Y20_022152 [Prymnesium parvum]|uniref:PH domain-containing protein n=1 Tax=Prymnesium parvum TaxID=97485 RepID=A0AB34JIN8_PRYPA
MLAGLTLKELRAKAEELGVDLTECVEKADIVARIEAREAVYEAEPSEAVGDWTKPQMKGYLTKDAVQSKSNARKRYFVLMGNFLMYYEDAKDSVFHPKGVWCLEDCRKGFMKRPGLNDRQAVLLRGKRELVITADSTEDLKEWNRAVQEASKLTTRNFLELQRSSEAELTKLRSQWNSLLVELEVQRSKLREEREARAKMELEAESVQDAQQALQDREEQMRTQLESEKMKLLEERSQFEEERNREVADEHEAAEAQKQAMQAQMDELKAQLHAEIEARREADILKEAAIKAQLEMEDKHNDLHWQVKQLQLDAEVAREKAKTLQHVSDQATRAARNSIVVQEREAADNAVAAATAAAQEAKAKTAEAEAALEQLEQTDAPKSSIMEESKAALTQLKQLCSRLSRIERPEATILYAEMMNARAKLVHAQEWLVDG